MANKIAAAWFPRVLGVVFLLLAILLLQEVVRVPVGQGEFLLLNVVLVGQAAWSAAVVNVVLLFGLAYGCLGARRQVIWPVLLYCAFWIVTIWSWSWAQPGEAGVRRLLTTLVAAGVLLAVCRAVLSHREEFTK